MGARATIGLCDVRYPDLFRCPVGSNGYAREHAIAHRRVDVRGVKGKETAVLEGLPELLQTGCVDCEAALGQDGRRATGLRTDIVRITGTVDRYSNHLAPRQQCLRWSPRNESPRVGIGPVGWEVRELR